MFILLRLKDVRTYKVFLANCISPRVISNGYVNTIRKSAYYSVCGLELSHLWLYFLLTISKRQIHFPMQTRKWYPERITRFLLLTSAVKFILACNGFGNTANLYNWQDLNWGMHCYLHKRHKEWSRLLDENMTW